MLTKALPGYLMSTLAFSDAGALSFHHVKYPFKHQIFVSFAFSAVGVKTVWVKIFGLTSNEFALSHAGRLAK